MEHPLTTGLINLSMTRQNIMNPPKPVSRYQQQLGTSTGGFVGLGRHKKKTDRMASQ